MIEILYEKQNMKHVFMKSTYHKNKKKLVFENKHFHLVKEN